MKYEENHLFEIEFEEEPVIIEKRVEAAERVIHFAKSIAPVWSGDYRDGLEVVIHGSSVYAAGTDWKSHFIEWGTVNQAPQAVLRRAVLANGLKFSPSKKGEVDG